MLCHSVSVIPNFSPITGQLIKIKCEVGNSFNVCLVTYKFEENFEIKF